MLGFGFGHDESMISVRKSEFGDFFRLVFISRTHNVQAIVLRSDGSVTAPRGHWIDIHVYRIKRRGPNLCLSSFPFHNGRTAQAAVSVSFNSCICSGNPPIQRLSEGCTSWYSPNCLLLNQYSAVFFHLPVCTTLSRHSNHQPLNGLEIFFDRSRRWIS